VSIKKPWTRPEVRRLHVAETFNPADGLSRAQWTAARELRRRADDGTSKASKTPADALH
jgi:hypothetical protein